MVAHAAQSSGTVTVLNSASATLGTTGKNNRASKLLAWLLAQLPATDYSVYTGCNAGERKGTKHRWWVLGDNACEALITAARQASLTAFNMHMRTEEQASIADAAQKRLRERGFDACPTCRPSLALGARDADAPRPIVTCELCHPRGRLCTGAVVESGGG